MPTNDTPTTLMNVGMGRAEEEFQAELARLASYYEDNNHKLGELKGKITLTIEVNGMRDEPTEPGKQGDIIGYRFVVQGAKTTFPPRLGKAQRARRDGESIVVDQDELDAHGTRRIPFAVVK